MKKTLFLLLLMLSALAVNAQGLYTTVLKYDKFDDQISKRMVKTLISVGDSLITIETKGSSPVEYYVIAGPIPTGSKSDPVELVDGVYGYQIDYFCVPFDERDDLFEELSKITEPDTESSMALAMKYSFVQITLRIVTYKYTGDFKDRLAWVKHKDGTRTIYTQD